MLFEPLSVQLVDLELPCFLISELSGGLKKATYPRDAAKRSHRKFLESASLARLMGLGNIGADYFLDATFWARDRLLGFHV